VRDALFGFPFWTWNKKNLALQAKQLFRHPGRVFGPVRVLGQDYGPDEVFLPEWARGELRLGVRFDSQLRMFTNIDLPFGSALDLLPIPGQVQAAMRRMTASMYPLPRGLFEVAAWKRNPFTGADIGSENRTRLRSMGDLAEAMRDHMGPVGRAIYRWFEARPGVDALTGREYVDVNAAKLYVLMQFFLVNRFASAALRYTDLLNRETPDFHGLLLDFAGGFRASKFDLDTRAEARVRSNLRVLKRRAREAGVLKDYPILYIPK
jgi:hypothetical protein